MKNTSLTSLISLVAYLLFSLQIQAQEIILYQDFESSLFTNLSHSDDTDILIGLPECSYTGVGYASTLNSESIDFLSTENSSMFLAVNPEQPCNGYYVAEVKSSLLDLSMYDSVVISCDYFISESLGWGPAELNMEVSDGSSSFEFTSLFTETGSWAEASISLDAAFLAENVQLLIEMGGGEGVAIDNLEIKGWTFSKRANLTTSPEFKVFPNPADEVLFIEGDNIQQIQIMNSIGNQVFSKVANYKNNKIMISDLPAGIYFVHISFDNNQSRTKRIMVR